MSRGLGRTQKAIIADVQHRWDDGAISTTRAIAESLDRDQRQIRKAVVKLADAGLLKVDYDEFIGWRGDCGPWRRYDPYGDFLDRSELVGMPVCGMFIYPPDAVTRQEAFVSDWLERNPDSALGRAILALDRSETE